MSKLTDTAPQRIFLQVSDEEGDEDCVFSDLQRDGAEVTWCDASMVCCEVEYVRADVARDEVAALRHLLFLSHGSAEHYLYGDDGQRDCNTCMIDFNTDSPAEIENKIRNHALKKMAIDAARAALEEGKCNG